MGGMTGGMSDGDVDLELADLLDSSFGAGPDGLPSPAERLTAGRQALRRRHRAGIAGTTAAVVAVVGLGAALSGAVGGHADADGLPLPLATSGTSAAPSTGPSQGATLTTSERQAALERLSRKAQQQAHRVEQRQVSSAFPVSYGSNGQLIVKDGWEITQRVEEPMGFQPPEASVGVVATDGEHTRWLLLTHEHAEDAQGHPLPNAFGGSGSADDPGKGYSRFEDWLASMVELQGGARTPPLVTVDDEDRVQPGPGAVVVETRPAPAIGGYTSDGDRMVEVRRDGRTWFAVVRGHGPDAEVIPVDAEVLDRADVRGVRRARAQPGRLGRGAAVSRGADDRDAAYVEYVAARQAHLRRIAYAVCGDWHRADDVLQTALTKLYLAWPRLRADVEPDAYVRRIIVRADIDERRRPWRRERSGLEGHDRAASGGLPVEERSALFEALQALPQMQRKTVVLRHWLGLSVEETARELAISTGTVKSHSSRGLTALQRVLAARGA